MDFRDEALARALGELSILRPLMIWFLAREAARSGDPAALLRELSEEMTAMLASMLADIGGTVQEGLDRLTAEALARQKAT